MLWSSENEFLAVTVHTDASADIRDKTNGASWRMGSVALQEDGPIEVGHVWLRTDRSLCEQFPGRFQGTHESGNTVRFTLLGREDQPMGDFHCEFRIDGPWFEVRVVRIDESLPSLVFPPPLQTESLVVPKGVGRWIKKPLAGRHFWVFPAHLNMRWFGGLRGEHGWLAVVDQGYTDAGVLAAQLSATTGWLKSLDRWQGPRAVRYCFVKGDYVTLAKTFRTYAKAKGLFRSLAEKAQSNPALKNLIGSRAVFFWLARTLHPENRASRLLPPADGAQTASLKVQLTYADVLNLAAQAKSAGLHRGLLALCGWIRGGYDELHPDIWPPEPALGSLEAFKALLAQPDPLTVAVHDNYQDIYTRAPSWPEGVNRLRSGAPMPGGFWAGGQAYILNSRASLAYLRRNWEQLGTLPLRAVYCDTTTAVQFYESHAPGDTQTRAEDEAGKIALLDFYKQRGVVLGSEGACDFGMLHTDFLLPFDQEHVPGETIPLWPLVFGDSVISYATCDAAKKPIAELRRQWLLQMLRGNHVRWYFSSQADWDLSREAFTESFIVDHWLERTATSEMLSHRFLADQVEQVSYANGLSLIVNFSDSDFAADGLHIPAGKHVIRKS